MGVVTGAFNIIAIIDGVNGTNGVAYGIRTNVESWHVNKDGLSPNALTWSYVVSDGTTTQVISSLVDAYAAGLSPMYKIDEGEITTAPSSFSINLYSHYKSVTIYLYKGDDIVAEKTIRSVYGVLSVIQQYYLSSSNTELIGGSWSSTPPTSILGMYLWVRTLTTYTDGTSSTSEPLLWNNNILPINKLINGDIEVVSDVNKVAEYVPLAPLVDGRKYRITFCATFADEVSLVGVSVSNGNKVLASFNPYPVENGEEVVATKQVFSFEFECDYFSGLTPDVDIKYANVRITQNVTGYVSTIHWAQIEVGLVSETKMYALSTDRLIAPTGNWSTTMPVSVVGTYVWEKRVQVYDDETTADVGILCLQGASGAKMRMRDWAANTEYLQGMSGEEYYDLVLYGNRLFLCLVSHTSSAEILPTNTDYWQIATDWMIIATKVLLAENGYIDLLEGNDIMAKDSEGNVTAGMSGSDDGIRFWAGANKENRANAPFKVDVNGAGQLAGGKLNWNSENNMQFTNNLESAEAGTGTFTDISEDGFRVYKNYPTSDPATKSVAEVKNTEVSVSSPSVGTAKMTFTGFSIGNYGIGLGGFHATDSVGTHNGVTGLYFIGDKVVTIKGGIITKIVDQNGTND